jgi:hypothetical protein
MAKVKILKPVVIRGKLHHKIGAIVEATEEEANRLKETGFAASADAKAEVDKSATIDASAMKKEETIVIETGGKKAKKEGGAE